MKNLRILLKRNIGIAIIAFISQGIWEYVVCGTYYNVEAIDNMTLLMVQATMGDVAITLTIFNLLLVISKSIKWKMDIKDLVIIILYAFAATAFFESRALRLDRWSYSVAMTYFMGSGIGLVPVLQLVILLPLSVVIENIVTFKVFKDENI